MKNIPRKFVPLIGTGIFIVLMVFLQLHVHRLPSIKEFAKNNVAAIAEPFSHISISADFLQK